MLLLVSLLFIVVINPYSLFKFNFFVLNTCLYTFYFILHFVVSTIMHGYNMVEPLYLW